MDPNQTPIFISTTHKTETVRNESSVMFLGLYWCMTGPVKPDTLYIKDSPFNPVE